MSDDAVDLVEEALHDIPPEYRERVGQLLGESLVPRSELRGEVLGYITTVEQVSQMVQMLDSATALRLSEVVMALLDHVTDDASEPSRRLVQLAAHYLVREDDDEEVTGVLGFDDDIQVINAVCRAVGRADLVTPLPEHGA